MYRDFSLGIAGYILLLLLYTRVFTSCQMIPLDIFLAMPLL